MKITRPPRIPAQTSDSFHQKLNAYTLAATAAGVSVLALTSSTEAKIIYTPTHQRIQSKHILRLDLNHDKITDFVLSNRSFSTTDVYGRTLRILPNGKRNQVAGKRGLGLVYYAYALDKGASIGPKQPFSGKVMAASGMEYGSVGPWRNVSERYLGLRFRVHGQIHYGWARLSVMADGKISAKLTGYAYETIPNRPIIAGKIKEQDVTIVEPATLGTLAQGRR